MAITSRRARELLYAAHDAWNDRDIDRLLALYHEDMSFWANIGGADGTPLVIEGKSAFRRQLLKWAEMEGASEPQSFRFENGVGRANVEFYIHDLETGHRHVLTFRQVATYRADKIFRLEEYHDAPTLAAFNALVSNRSG